MDTSKATAAAAISIAQTGQPPDTTAAQAEGEGKTGGRSPMVAAVGWPGCCCSASS